uniref:GCS light chain n=1 Tax=Timema cristinae TaxID=61476 RepID=A0A7R9GQ71_TIMCR|nr:unnamed protein product [Timema cristinae]
MDEIELIESLKITLSSWQPKNDGVGQHLQIRRTEGSPMSQLENEDRSGLKVSVKVFISSLKKEALHESLNSNSPVIELFLSVFSTLDMEYIDSLVLAYPSKSEPTLLLAALKELWQILEDYVERKKLHSIGVSDVDTEVFIALYDWAKVSYKQFKNKLIDNNRDLAAVSSDGSIWVGGSHFVLGAQVSSSPQVQRSVGQQGICSLRSSLTIATQQC